jgi:hypothetical protein
MLGYDCEDLRTKKGLNIEGLSILTQILGWDPLQDDDRIKV